MVWTKQDRFIAIDTPLGPDALLLTAFKGTEAISELFRFDLDLWSENHGIVFNDIIGANATLSVMLANGEERFFNGIISRFSQKTGETEVGVGRRFGHYAATMVPWFWLLTRTTDSRIFQGLSVPDIVEKLLAEKGFFDYTLRLAESYAPRDYCVQYRETDFNFVSRLLEEEGIYYFFEHEEGKHTLVLADTPEQNLPLPKQESVPFAAKLGGWLREDVITDIERTQRIQSNKYTANAFDFQKPSTDLKVEVQSQISPGSGEMEVYDHPLYFTARSDGDRLARIRMQEHEAKVTTITGSSDCRAFTSGYRFKLLRYHVDYMNEKEYMLTSVEHKATQSLEASLDQIDSELTYTNRFTCIPFEVPYRPQRRTPKPLIRGSQTAIVVGPPEEQIYTDEHARVKVQFHWDREGQRDENSSCWIRVSQAWAGAGWGSMHIPHVGQEVIVDFLEGDPDRPVITGRVYHGTNRPHFALPQNKHKSIIHDNYGNEIVFDATPGDEHIRIHSPHHNSGLDIGKSVNVWTTSDDNSVKLGNQMEIAAGMKTELLGGAATEFKAGLITEITLGTQLDISWGGTFKYEFAWESKHSSGPMISSSKADILSLAQDDQVVGAGDGLGFIAGARGNKNWRSIANLFPDRLSLSVGPKNVRNVRTQELFTGQLFKNYLPDRDWAWWAAPFISLFAALIPVAFGWFVPPEEDKTERYDPNWTHIASLALGSVLGLASITYGVGRWGWEQYSAKRQARIEPVKHVEPTAIVELEKDGTVLIAGEQGVHISGDQFLTARATADAYKQEVTISCEDGRITLDKKSDINIKSANQLFIQSNGEIFLDGKRGVYAKGHFKHKNLTILA